MWTTFNSCQWDLNWTNPDGVRRVRRDRAVAGEPRVSRCSGWTRSRSCGSGLGTNCQNQPEVHSIAQALRAVLRIAAPAVLFKAEAIVAPHDLVQYLGQGRHHGKVSDLAYHNTLMVQIWSMLASRDVRLAVQALRALPPVPSSTAWICYLRCHDDIGWAIDDRDAAAAGLTGFAHRAFLSDFYTGLLSGHVRARPGISEQPGHW